jgi:predicted tellurium resistance membrane protein TerC
MLGPILRKLLALVVLVGVQAFAQTVTQSEREETYFRYLKFGLSLVLVFIGLKMVLDPHEHTPRWFQIDIPIWVSLVVVGNIILLSVICSVIAGRLDRRRAPTQPEVNAK